MYEKFAYDKNKLTPEECDRMGYLDDLGDKRTIEEAKEINDLYKKALMTDSEKRIKWIQSILNDIKQEITTINITIKTIEEELKKIS